MSKKEEIKKEEMVKEVKTPPVKPMTLAKEEFVSNIVNLCNNSGLPTFVMEDILNKIVDEIHVISNRQLESDRERYNREMLEFQKSLNEKKEAE